MQMFGRYRSMSSAGMGTDKSGTGVRAPSCASARDSENGCQKIGDSSALGRDSENACQKMGGSCALAPDVADSCGLAASGVINRPNHRRGTSPEHAENNTHAISRFKRVLLTTAC